MLRFASSLGGSRSFDDRGTCLQSCRGAVSCAAAAGARKRRSSPARTTAEIAVGHLNRPAHGLAVGMRVDFDGITHHASALLAAMRLRAPQGAARYSGVGDGLADSG